MIEVGQLSKRYGNYATMDRPDFTVKPVTGLPGRRGPGKSTTMPTW